ncbi:hypothetical protein K7432_003968 [Basidiobolus ranarum]|uniref:G domain-containing protein n=1 Tax=Basidiobolus ranarum TaxID=34480 RepID=A0ABR2WYX8_9FUNG
MRVKLPKVYENIEQPLNTCLLHVAVVGAVNTGTSTMVNNLVDDEILIVSTKPQTTREHILGIMTGKDTRLVSHKKFEKKIPWNLIRYF